MKQTDNYKAKLKIWVEEGQVVRMPRAINLPPFKCKRFSSGTEMNAWKKEYLAEIARRGGVKWTTTGY